MEAFGTFRRKVERNASNDATKQLQHRKNIVFLESYNEIANLEGKTVSEKNTLHAHIYHAACVVQQ